MQNRKAILAAATFLCLFPLAPVSLAQSEGGLAATSAQAGPVTVTFDRAEAKYAIGEIVGLFIQSSENAFVTVLNVSPNGNVVKLFPNKFQPESLVPAGERVQVPDPASGAQLQVSGPVGQEQIKVFYSNKPLDIFADIGGGSDGMFRSIDGGMDEVSRSLDQARSLGAKIKSRTLTLTTVESLPAPAVTGTSEPETTKAIEETTSPAKPADDTPGKPKPSQTATAAELPKKKPETKQVASNKPKPKAYHVAPKLAPGQVLAADELELVGKAPNTKTIFASSSKPHQSQAAQQAPQMQLPQFQMPQMQMPQIQMPQIQLPQLQLPGGMQLQLPQLQIPTGRSAEREETAGTATALASAGAPQVCVQMLDKLNASITAKDIATAATDADAIAVSAECGQFQIVAQRRIATMRLSTAQEMMADDRPLADYEALLIEAGSPRVLWQASATLGEVHFDERRFADAAAEFQQAIEIIKNETRTPKAPSADIIKDLIQRAAQARILAANPSNENPQGTFVPVEKDHRSGMLGGIYSQDVRGIRPVSIPVPITFEFNESKFTPIGSEAAQELLEAIKEQKPGRVVLVGHTDRRGGDDYNQKLSVRRAQAVADFLKSNGIEASIEADGRGASEPVDVATTTANLTDEDIDALNRRVEWRHE
ncbi:DUF4384 domain-containing protein [Mesorhizobium sp. KR1-2]|uniref:DUF4384 domain-containing protein n=1 Tax=Mesorhizobium sp. KR1-2 TaxID=3156609 RepID=UPI0032B3FDFC